MEKEQTSRYRTFARVQKNGRVTIPAPVRRRLGIEAGDLVAFQETEDGILISLPHDVAAEVFDRIGRALQDGAITMEELVESGRETRAEIVRERYGLVAEEHVP